MTIIDFIKKNKIDILLFIIAWFVSFAVKDFVFHREVRRIAEISRIEHPPSGTFVPFNIESAMAFNYAWQIGSGRFNLLGPDAKLVGLEKLDVNRQFNVGNEYFLGYGYRFKKILFGAPKISEKDKVYEDDPFFSSWISFQTRLWTSLTSALIFAYIRLLGMPLPFAVLGAVLHSVSPGAIARHTGQEILGETFAFPFISATAIFALLFIKRMSRAKIAIFTVLAFISLAVWDMTQILFSVLAITEIIRIAIGGGSGRARKKLWLGLATASIAAAIFIPYHKEHILIFSPLIICFIPSVIISQNLFQKKKFNLIRLAKIAGITLCLFLIASFVGKVSGYSERYSHFSKLIEAKIKFGNVKPQNPALLDFDARVLWTPAMHSADRLILKSYFPAALYLLPVFAIFATAMALCSRRFASILRFRSAWFFTNTAFFIFYLVGFFYIVRYHVFLAAFMCVLLPQLAYIFCGYKNGNNSLLNLRRIVTWSVIFLALMAECLATLRQVRQYQDFFFAEASSLIKWCREEGVSNKVFLADITISPMLLAYCNAGIVLQPKFENKTTRQKFEDFVKIIFHGSERDLMKFCQVNSADYFIYDKGLIGPMNIYSMSYFANATTLSPQCPAYLMGLASKSKKLRYFYEIAVPENLKIIQNRYKIFKVITDDDSVNSARWVLDARDFLKKGNFDMARRLAKAAVYADPNNFSARLFYAEIYGEAANIRLRGF